MYAAAITAAALILAHDVYGDLRCTADPVTGDCEWVDFRLLTNGDVEIVSHRHLAWIHVARNALVWLPIPGCDHPAHWCGVRRKPVYAGPPTADYPDPRFLTFCAFIDLGGT
ncbi:hypothetical protein [Alsobacter sp. SYSU BS001988]